MTQEPAPSGPAWGFHEIKVTPPERPYAYRSISSLTYATIALVGLNALVELIQFAALLGQWRLLGQIRDHAFASQDAMDAAAHASDGFVAVTALLTLVTLVLAYIVAGFWIYNAACNVRALGARGLQITPGWAVGWYAVPVASLFRPFQAMAEIYRGSVAPVGWAQVKTPLLLRLWWAAWLLAGIGGYALALAARSMSEIPDLILLTELQLADAVVDITAAALFMTVVWTVFRAQVFSQSQNAQLAQVFA
jgi:hypothetical protein